MAVGSLLARSHLEPIVPRRFHVIRDGHIIVGYAHLDKVRREFGYYKGVYQPTALDHEVRTTEKIRAQRAVKKAIDKPKHRYAQIFNPAVDRWVKVDAKLGGVVAYKKSKGEYKGIPIFEKDKSKKEEGEINAN
jgi:hypothetical protein